LKITDILNNVFRPPKTLKKTRIKLYNTLTLPVLLCGSKTWTVKTRDARRITAAEMKYMRRTAGYTWTDYKTNTQITKKLKITQILDKLLEYKRNWIEHVNRMPHNRLRRVIKHYSPTGRRNHGRPLKRLLDTWDQNGSTSGPTPMIDIWWWWWWWCRQNLTQSEILWRWQLHIVGNDCHTAFLQNSVAILAWKKEDLNCSEMLKTQWIRADWQWLTMIIHMWEMCVKDCLVFIFDIVADLFVMCSTLQ